MGGRSLIADAPARGEGKNDPATPKVETARDEQAEMVILERRALDFLLARRDIDPKRIAYVGHSYGGAAGGVAGAANARRTCLNLRII